MYVHSSLYVPRPLQVQYEEKRLKDERKERVKHLFLAESPRTNGGSSNSGAEGHQTENRCPLCLAEWDDK